MEIILFIDQVGFTVVGEKIEINDKHLKVKNPAVLQAAPNQQNQLQVQLLPVLFKEFLDSSEKNKGVTFSYPIDKVVFSDATLDSRLVSQYQSLLNPQPQAAGSQTPNDPEVIKLFDE
jgi:hypothetical protein